MKLLITRLSDKRAQPLPSARLVGQTMFGDPVYGVEVQTIEEVFNLAARAKTSAPGDVGVILWRRAPVGMSLPPELENFPLAEIYDDIKP